MKLIIQGNKVAAVATDEYQGNEQVIDSPADFDPAKIDHYAVKDGVVSLAAPTSVTRAQARKALVLAGRFADVQPAIDAIPDPVQRQLVQIDWDDRLTFERDNPTLLALSSALGFTDAELDDLFVQASAL